MANYQKTGIKEKMTYEFVLNEQIRHIYEVLNIMPSMQKAQYLKESVGTLRTGLAPYLDAEYFEEEETIEKDFEVDVDLEVIRGKERKKKILTNAWIHQTINTERARFQLLLKFLDDKNLLLKTTISATFGDEEDVAGKELASLLKKKVMGTKEDDLIILVSGHRGKGKSLACLTIGESLDDKFSIKKVAWNTSELMNLVNDDSIGAGEVIILEEAGINISSKNWMRTDNQVVSNSITISRPRRRILILNIPYIDMVDSSIRKMIKAKLNMLEVDMKSQKSRGKLYFVNYNEQEKEFYRRLIAIRINKRGKKAYFNNIFFKKPSKKILRQYKKARLEYMKKINEESADSITTMKVTEKERKRKLTTPQIISAVWKRRGYYSRIWHGKKLVNKQLVEADFGISSRISGKVKAAIEKRWQIEKKKKKLHK